MSTLVAGDEITITPEAALTDTASWVKAMGQFLADAAKEGKTVRVVAEEETFTPRETAAALDISRSAVQRAIVAGEMKTIRRGTHYRVTASEIRRYRRQMLDRMSKAMADAF
ncbi:MAG: helix-turn-helix domain-containing protein [Propionibacteriaceae bacterium]|jgi:excisionase family DNA binding protein|nr:helix-turn-helix domain-containing protein [Propionibacteriaceae bacterium]